MMRNFETDLKKTVMPLTYGFSWLQEVILYSNITKFSDMEDSFENDACWNAPIALQHNNCW